MPPLNSLQRLSFSSAPILQQFARFAFWDIQMRPARQVA
jgi:hypothetical protein